MARPYLRALVLLSACLTPLTALRAEDSHSAAPLGWIHLQDSAEELASRPGHYPGKALKLTRGALVPVLKTRDKNGTQWAQVRFLDLATDTQQTGWLEEEQKKILPAEAYPPDSALLSKVGQPFVDDFAVQHTQSARFVLPQVSGSPLLLCYFYSSPLPVAELVAFVKSGEKFLPKASLEFPISELHSGPVYLEVRDLLGEGNHCFITHEAFREGPETRGMNLVIRTIAGNEFRTLWQAPLEYRSLTEFRSKIQILDPPEKNIAVPGTVAKGEVTFRAQGKVQEPVWKGKVEFFLFGREEAVDSIRFEKACPWNGKEFAPLR